uniref:Uncharacterized protein n=1 Tax=Nelumbo nucifera TaxID=4432 RepID=A0A822ZL79_NELNU|nr:TPA_asm: hypothetical protein HUJ06_003480 [Nelumbo nucifera]
MFFMISSLLPSISLVAPSVVVYSCKSNSHVTPTIEDGTEVNHQLKTVTVVDPD